MYDLRSYSARSCYNNNHRLEIGRIFSATKQMFTFLSLLQFSWKRKCVSHVVTKWHMMVTVEARVSAEIHMVFRESWNQYIHTNYSGHQLNCDDNTLVSSTYIILKNHHLNTIALPFHHNVGTRVFSAHSNILFEFLYKNFFSLSHQKNKNNQQFHIKNFCHTKLQYLQNKLLPNKNKHWIVQHEIELEFNFF